MKRPFSVLVASDGSREARAAVALAVSFPWPPDVRVVGLVATDTPPVLGLGALFRGVLAQSYEREARRLDRVLRSRFVDSRVRLVRMEPAQAILRESRRCGADIVVVGSRGLGAVGRFPLGSVSRRVVREAPTAVLVARGRPRGLRRFMVALDGSPAASAAVRLLGRLTPQARSCVLLASVTPRVPVPLMGRVPAAVRSRVTRLAATEAEKRASSARRRVEAAAGRLRRAGWKVETAVQQGTPLLELLRAAAAWRPDVVVVGAGSRSGLNRLLLGSVADGMVARSGVPVLIAR